MPKILSINTKLQQYYVEEFSNIINSLKLIKKTQFYNIFDQLNAANKLFEGAHQKLKFSVCYTTIILFSHILPFLLRINPSFVFNI